MAGQYELGDLSSVLGGDLYSSLFGTQGFTGNSSGGWQGDNPWMTEFGGQTDSGNSMFGWTPNENALSAFDNYSFNWSPSGGVGGGTLDAFDPSGKTYGSFKQEDEDGITQLMDMVAPAVASWGFGGALSGMFGGGALGGAAGHGLASGTMSSMQGGKFTDGFLSGAIGGGLNGLASGTPAVMGNNPSAYVPATPGTSIAGLSGITNPTLAGMVNRGAGSALGALATGKSGSEALQSGLTGAALSGLNSAGKGVMDFYKNSLSSWLTPDAGSGNSDVEFDSLPGNMVSDPMDHSVPEMAYSDEGGRFDNSADFSYGFQQPTFLDSGESPQQRALSSGQSDFSLPSIFGDAGRSVGNFALNNAGDLASMLYGFYNNRRQQKALGQQINSLQGLYGQNSPYAQQLRNQLNAKAAATGRRSNTAGRATQLQAMLADRAASMAPTLMQLNQARGGLKNNNMNMLLQGVNKMGGFKALGSGLQSLFGGNNTYQDGGFNLTGMQNPYGSDVAFNNWGG